MAYSLNIETSLDCPIPQWRPKHNEISDDLCDLMSRGVLNLNVIARDAHWDIKYGCASPTRSTIKLLLFPVKRASKYRPQDSEAPVVPSESAVSGLRIAAST